MERLVNIETGEVLNAKKESRAREDKDFIKMYRRQIANFSELGVQHPNAMRVLCLLVRNMDNRNALVIKQDMLAQMLQLSRQTVSKCIKYLENNGWIAVGKVSNANVYVVNPEFAWTAYADEKSYCSFDAKVMLSLEDNLEIGKKDASHYKVVNAEVLMELDSAAKTLSTIATEAS